MSKQIRSLLLTVLLAGLVWLPRDCKAAAADTAPAALAGSVTSQAEGPMEGVVVRAKPVGGTIAVSVVSDAQGRYSFPQSRLQPGKYQLSIRAAGYDLEGSGAADVVGNKTANADLKLVKAKDLASQLMSTEWIISAPGTKEQKMQLYECIHCHSAMPIVSSKHTPAEFTKLFDRMRNHGPMAFLLKPVDLPYKEDRPIAGEDKLAEYLSSINLSNSKDGKWSYELKTLPRPKGKATKVIITEYDLPNRLSEPHDAVLDRDGMVWFTEFGRSFVGRLNPRTGEVKEWPVPILKPGFPEGNLDIKFDQDGNPWFTMLFQGGVAKFDKKKIGRAHV